MTAISSAPNGSKTAPAVIISTATNSILPAKTTAAIMIGTAAGRPAPRA